MNALLQARLTQEVKDAMVGHKREGARNDYAITELTIKTSYSEAFRYLTINGYGSQARKLVELQKKQEEDRIRLETKLQDDHETLITVIKNQNNQMEMMKDIIRRMELFKVLETPEEWKRTTEFLNTIRTEKIKKAEEEAEEHEEEARDRALGKENTKNA
jgi:hypothetical protein